MCRAEPGLSDQGGGVAEARLTVNGEKAGLPRGPSPSWDREWTEGARANAVGVAWKEPYTQRGLETDLLKARLLEESEFGGSMA